MADERRPKPRSSQATSPPFDRSAFALWGVIAAVWLLLDQATKALAVARLEGRPPIDLGVFDLNVIRNPGGAFGVPGLFPGLFVIVTVVVVALVLRALRTADRLGLLLAYGLVTGGALGNVIDRLVRAPGFPSGHVVDFIDLRWWPVFNFADIGICVGAFLIALLLAKAESGEQAALGAAAPE